MASWGYETLLGVADFAAATLAGWGNIGTTLTILATERGTERFLQVLDQGGTMEQAFWSGVTTGALDRILNKLPVEKLLGKSSAKVRQTLWKTMKEQGLLQMGSEAAGRVTDIVADTVVMGEQSEYKRLEAQYLKQGLNGKEARRQALLNLAGSVAVSGGSGLVQGAALGSVAQLARRLFQMGNSGAEIEQEQPVQYINAEPGSPEDNVRDLYAYYRKQTQIDSAAKDGIMEAESQNSYKTNDVNSAEFQFQTNEEAYKYYTDLVEILDVSTAENTAIFYSGPGNRALAENFAGINQKVTLEMTSGGKYLDDLKLFEDRSPLTKQQASEVWKRLSERYAAQASGNVYGFVLGSREQSIFKTIELPTLERNKNITNIFTELFNL